MRHSRLITRFASRLLLGLVIASLLAAALPPATGTAQGLSVLGRTDSPAEVTARGLSVLPRTDSPADSPVIGSLRFSPAVDADDSAASNPSAAAPVMRIGPAGAADPALDVRYAVVALAVEVMPDDATRNPAGVMVEFRLWDDAGTVDLTQRARADAWGAASAEFLLDDLHLAGQFHYSASAAGYRAAPPRAFVFDQQAYSQDVQLGAARLTTAIEADGRLVVDVESDVAIDDSLLAVQLTAVRLIPTPSGEPDKTLLPPLVARRLDDRHARAEIYLEAGDYLISASAASGKIEARSQPALVQIVHVDPPPVAAVEDFFDVSDDGETALVQYRTSDGDVALLPRTLADLPAEAEQPAAPPVFQQQTRVGPFQWRSQVYSTTVETVVDDGKKLVTLDGFSYDPIARTYDIKIESLMDEAVEDKLTVQVFGPNRVVIWEETVPIWLDPAEPFHYQFSLPSDRGEPTGLRIHVHDPLDFDWALQLISDSVTTLYNTLGSAVAGSGVQLPLGLSFSLTAGFGFSLKVVEIDVISASISCTAGECKAKAPTGIFFGVDPWLGVVTDGVKTFLRNQYRDILATDDMDAILKKLGEGINLGALTLSATASARLTYNLVDPGSCVNQQALDQAKQYVADLGFAAKDLGDTITFRAKTLSESLQSKGKINLAVPGAWFLGVQLSPVLAFKLKGDKSGEFAVYAELQVELGGKATVKLKASAIFDTIFALLGAKEYVVGIYRILDIARTSQKLFTMLSSASAYAAGGGCSSGGGGNGGSGGGRRNPPPPNGSPDDRRDAFQSQFLPDPRGISGDIQSLQQQIAIAQDAGLTRAATFFTVKLRLQELAAFNLDNARVISHTAELDGVYDQAYLRITGLISGTVLPDPGQTITDAVRSTYTGYLIDIAQTDYSQERRALLDSLDFAQRQYSLLRGQELELQYELRQMIAAAGVGVINSGLVEDAIGAIGSLGVRVQPIEIVAGSGSAPLPSSRYVTPYQAPPVVIVPSGGLYRYGDSDEAAAWLETYVAIGGTLLVLAQFDSADWEMLPGGQVRGLGYDQDILCKQASVRIVNSSPWIVGIGRDLPDIQIDGSFTQWPSDATVLLMRTTGNMMPAMIEYPYGLGTVVATSAYPDFYMNGMQSAEDIIFARGLFGAAYLHATGQSPAASLAPNQATTLSLEITNSSAVTATQVTLYRDYYANAIGDSWRWAVHQPDPFGAVQTLPLNPPLLSGASRTVSFNFAAPSQAGLFRLGYFMGGITATGLHWNIAGAAPGVFYQVLSAPVRTDLFRFRLAADQPAYDFGQTATLTATLLNDRAVARTFSLEVLSGLSAAPANVTVGPHSTATRTYTLAVDRTRPVRLAAVENGVTVSELVATVRLKLPTLGLSGALDEALAGVAVNAMVTATVSNAPAGTTTVDWEVRQNGALLSATATPLSGTPGSSLAQLAVALPAAPPDTIFTVRAALPNTSRSMTKTIPVLAPVRIRSVLQAGSPVIGDPNPDALAVSLLDPGYAGQYAVQALLKEGSTVLASSPIVTGVTGGGVAYETFDLPLPPALTLGVTTTIVVSASGQFAGGSARYPDSYEAPLPLAAPQVSLANAVRNAGQPLDITVASLPGDVVLPPAGPFDVLLTGPYAYEALLVEGITPLSGRGVTLHTRVPSYLYSGGRFDVQVSAPALAGWLSHSDLSVPPHRINLAAPPALAAGDVLTVTLQNSGGVTATVNGALQLLDRQDVVVAETSFSVSAPAGGGADIALPLPAQLKSGRYTVRSAGNDQLSQPVTRSRSIQLNGLAVELASRADQPAYLASDLIATTSVITAGQPLAGASLRLRVLGAPPQATAWDGWLGRRAGGGRSNAVSQTAAGPFTPSWSTTPQAYDVSPVAVDDLVIVALGQCGSLAVQALDSLDGSVRWGPSPLPFYPIALAANREAVFALTAPYCPSAAEHSQQPQTGYHLTAFDSATGSQLWQVEFDSSSDLLASESAVALFDSSINGYRLLDASDGSAVAVFNDTEHALLVDNRFYTEDAADTLAAYDAASGGLLWSVAMPEGSELRMADNTFVLAFQEYDYSTFDLVNRLHLYAPASGAHLGAVTLSLYPYQASSILLNDRFYYLTVDTGGGTRSPADVVSTLYAVDLGSLSESVLFSSEHEMSALVGSGDRLHLVDRNDQALVSLDAASGALLGQSDISASGASTIDQLAVQQFGLLALESGGYEVHALQGSGPVSGGGERAVAATSVLREDWLAVDGNGVLSLPLALTNPDLGDNPQARGLLYLEGVLYGAEPAALPVSSRQPLARSVYPFTVNNAPTSVELHTDRPAYRRNVSGYTPDDALSAVALSGRVRNTGLSPDDITLQILRSDGATLLSQTFSAVAPNATRDFSLSDPAPPTGSLVYTATTSLGHSAVAQIQVTPAAVSAASTVTPASIALGESATIEVSLANGGALPGVVTVDLGDGPQTLTLAAGEGETLTRALTPATAGALSLPVLFSGDVSRTDMLALDVREESATVSIELSGTVRSAVAAPGAHSPAAPALVQGADAALDVALVNAQSFDFEATVDYLLSGPESRAGSQVVTLLPGPATVHVPLGALLTGDYSATVTVRHARLGTVIASASLSFSVVSPLYDLAVAASAGEMDAAGQVVVVVTASSAAGSEQPWSGTLLIEDGDDAVRREAILLPPGASAAFSETLSLLDRAGPQPLHVALVGPDGATLAEQTLTVDGPARLAPAALLTGLTASAGAPGGPVTLTATIANDGPAGDAPLTFLAFDQTYEVLADLPAHGSRTAALVVTAPAGLLAGSYPAEARLGEQTAEAEITLSGAQVELTQSLDAASYQPFSLATWTVHLHGVGGPATYDVIRRYVTQATSDTVTLNPGQTLHLPWTFDVGPASNRAQVIVRPHVSENDENTPFALAIDSQWVPVIEDPYAWLESDKARYNAGETVHLTMHLLRPTDAAYVLRPAEIESTASPLLWSNVLLTSTWTITNPLTMGDFAIDYALPATLRTGRYHFVYAYDSEERSLPIDVFGVSLLTRDYAVAGPTPGAPLQPGDPLTLTASLRLDAPAGPLLIIASDLAPDGNRYSLGAQASLVTALPAGETPITLHGVLPDSTHSPQAALPPGTHQIELRVMDAATLALLGGDTAFVDVGAAVITDLSTDHGVYSPGQTGIGTLVAFGQGAATVHVETSGGTALLHQNVTLSGFHAYTFAIPTASAGDKGLIGTVTDSGGLASSLQSAYKVAASFDTTPPEVKILSPANGEAVALPGSHQIAVSGVFTEDVAIDTVLVNGVPAALAGNTWTATMTATLGSNLIQAVALDAAGNPSAPDLVDAFGEVAYGIAFSVTPTTTAVNGVVAYSAVVTTSEAMTATVLFPFSMKAVAPSNGSASSGLLNLNAPVSWQGMVAPGQPVTIQWQGLATEPISRTVSALAQGEQLMPRFSQDVEVLVTGAPLAVTLASFGAFFEGNAVLVTWETVSELNNRGFNLYRGLDPDGPRELLAFVPSTAPGSSQGAVYQWRDDTSPPAAAVYYWLEAVDFSGVTSLFGPISVVTLPPTGVRLVGFEAASPSLPSDGLIAKGIAVLALLVGGIAAHVRGAPPTPLQAAFDPDQVAYFEKAGWQAYYDRRWLRVLWLMVQLNREQFGMSLPSAIAAALDIVRATVAFAPVDNDVPAAAAHLQRYYARARRAAGIQADAATLAQLEMDYWVVHRRLAVARRDDPNHAGDIEPMVEALTALHAALFDAPPAAMRPSAELRAQAALVVDRITGGYSTDVAADWREVERLLQQAYRSVQPAAAQNEQQVSSFRSGN